MLQDIIRAPRTDAIYNMHGYLTKVPVAAIIPFIEEYTKENDLVADIFAGSGMTAIAARMSNRQAVVSDISILGKHIGQGYLTKVDHDIFLKTADELIDQSKKNVGHFYKTLRNTDMQEVELIRTIWSYNYECPHCNKKINYYDSLCEADWEKKKMSCPNCKIIFDKKKSKFLGEEPVYVVVKDKNGRQVNQKINEIDLEKIEKATQSDIMDKLPNFSIAPEREMYRKSALKKWNLTETKKFFSHRNAIILYDLWSRINKLTDKNIKKKLLFCFTAILPRASKRYQWSHKAPLNAANQTYYIAPVFYEWNVYDLFNRKINAAIRSDSLIMQNNPKNFNQQYITSSASDLKHFKDNDVNYIFTDPPFGSNIYYADMNLFQEAWLKKNTEYHNEAVIKTAGNKEDKKQSEENYKKLLTYSFQEAYRVLKPGGYLSVVFGNSKGNIWSMAIDAIKDAGFKGKPTRISILDKGQRSVKGLASGFESVTTLDLIITFQKPLSDTSEDAIVTEEFNDSFVLESLKNLDLNNITASHIYLEILRNAIYKNINIKTIDLSTIVKILKNNNYYIDEKSGFLIYKV